MALLLGSTWVPLARAPGTERAGAGAKSHSMLRVQAPGHGQLSLCWVRWRPGLKALWVPGCQDPHNQPTSGGIVTPTYTRED